MLLKHAPARSPDALLKFNPNHEPAGSPQGGQFASSGGGSSGGSTKAQGSHAAHEAHLSHEQMHALASDHDMATAFHGFPRIDGLSEKDQVIEDKSIYRYLTDRSGLMKEYYQNNGNKVANADQARPLFKPEGYNGINSPAVHEASSALNKDIWRNNLATNPEKEAWLYAGGSGSGKTSAIEHTIPGIQDRAAAILDGNLSGIKSAMDRIAEAGRAGKDVQIAYVYRDPTDAWENGVIKRMLGNPKEGGRVVAMSTFLSNTGPSLDTVRALKAQGVKVTAIDNSRGKGGQRIMSGAEFDRLSVPSKAELRPQLMAATERLLNSGKISREQYHALIQ